MPKEEIKDKDVKIGDKTVGFSSIVKLNVKTLFWFFGILYVLAGYGYYDLRKDMNQSNSILKEEKQEFFNGVQTTLYKDITDIKVGMESMKGDIRVILDRQNRDNPVIPSNTAVQPIVPPPININPDTTGQ